MGGAPLGVFEAFLTSKDRKIKANGGWLKIYDFKKTFALAYSMPSSATFIVTELSRVSKVSKSQDPGFKRNIARDLGERKIS